MKLRKMTSAGMMDCKKALEEAGGDFDKAVGIIREKGKLVAAKRADRETSEGAVKTRISGNKALIVCLGCETDFVSRNADFQNLANAIADVAIAQCPADLEALKACRMSDGYTVEEAVEAQTGKTGEKHVLAYYALVEAPFVAEYVHTLNGKLGAIVGFNKEVPAELAKGIVMQVASMNPVAVSPEECPQEVIDNELKVAVEKTKEELVQKAVNAALEKAGINPAHVDSEDHIESNTAKGWLTPEQMVNNIAHGRLQKFFKEQTLMEQEYQMGDGKQSVKEVIAATDKDIKVLAFRRFSLND